MATKEEKATAILDALKAKPDKKFKVKEKDLTFLKPPAVIDGHLHVWVSVVVDGVEQVNDPHFVFVNPPIEVPDGTFYELLDEDGQSFQEPNMKVDPEAAFDFILAEAVDAFLKKVKS